MKLTNPFKHCSTLDVDPDDLAGQLTLIDLPIFKSIKRDELLQSTSNCAAKNCSNPCLNVAAMKRQFNQVAFLVIDQVLAHGSFRQRAELISQLIKTAKSLFQLNNLHSSKAIVSALLSSPIYRLKRTWSYVEKKYPKDRRNFDRLKDLYADTNNYESLRSHLADCDLPCIPYLGMYSRDIIYINEAHQEGTLQRAKSTNKILESIEKFQLSEYGNLTPSPDVQSFLLSSRYLDEMQKFVEDENHRKSLELEPADNGFTCSYNNSVAADNSSLDLPARLNHSFSSASITVQRSDQAQQKRSNVLAGLTCMVHSAVASTSHKLGHGLNSANSSPALRVETSRSPARPTRYLIDDSILVGGSN